MVMQLWESAVSRLTDPIDPAFVRQFQETPWPGRFPPPFLDMVVRESLKVPARVWRAAFEGFLEDDVAGDLGRYPGAHPHRPGRPRCPPLASRRG